jgi:hypothetical protein
MEPRTIEGGQKQQNGDVESLNGAFKRRVAQHLALRGSSQFDSRPQYELWLCEVLEKGNRLRGERLAEELGLMRPLVASRLPDWSELEVPVSQWSTIRVKFNTCSVPSRLRGERVRVRLYEERLEVYYAGQLQMGTERLRGRAGHRINYRHIIWSLVRKPGAFARYRYREGLFPALVFRQAYDALSQNRSPEKADVHYLRILHLSASTSQAEVEAALGRLLAAGEVPLWERVKAEVAPPRPEIPALAELAVDLGSYDALLGGCEEVGA